MVNCIYIPFRGIAKDGDKFSYGLTPRARAATLLERLQAIEERERTKLNPDHLNALAGVMVVCFLIRHGEVVVAHDCTDHERAMGPIRWAKYVQSLAGNELHQRFRAKYIRDQLEARKPKPKPFGHDLDDDYSWGPK